MFLRRMSAGLVAAAVSASAVALVAGPASADPTSTPAATDLVGVGSDTTEIAVGNLANAWNAQSPAPSFKIGSFDALGSATIVLKQGTTAVNRPNGSSQGKAVLYGSGNNTNVDFARSSSALSAAELNAGLKAFPFALDTLGAAVAKTTNAPASITVANLVDIYSGKVTNWSQVGGKDGVIVPLIPQSGSGTRSFFLAQLKAANGGNDVTLASSVKETQEHDPKDINGNPNAVAPFSAGRAKLAANASQVSVLGGWTAARAVYNVLRGADIDKANFKSVFGSDGFFCSTAARSAIEAGGLDQLARPAAGGVCGEAPATGTTSNFTTNKAVVTKTSLAGTSPAAGAVRLVATVDAGGSSVDGTVDFFEGATKVGSAAYAQGQAVLSLTGVAAGSHSYTATFTPATGSTLEGSTSSAATVVVKSASTTAVAVAGSGTWGNARTVTATVTAGDVAPTGTVAFKVGSATKTVALSGGKAVYTIPATAGVGTYAISAVYSGNDALASSTGTATFKVVKAKSSATESFASSVAKGGKAKGVVTVKLSGSKASPTGTVTVLRGSKVVGRGTLKAGKVTLTLASLPKGRNTLKISYAGTSNIAGTTKSFVIVQK